ncbi:MAG: DNA translocase FtsK 4TM domain-containing protein, partial [Paracoccaceae bacterium]|nr:DNA translocase FtsK 4TM domain-containing protein [Paracoccaceae bacterium]
MASYPAKRRDPLLDQKTQAVIERRGKELIGAGLVAAGVAVALMLASYMPDDPSWLSATDTEAQNFLGRFGASIASPLTVIVGFGAWGIAAVSLAWGVRFILHNGSDRALTRLIFAPIAIALAAIYASTHVPPAGWTHSFGLGGLFGDTVLGALLGLMPLAPGFALKLLSFLAAAGVVGLGLFVLGFDKRELKLVGRVLLVGSILGYALLASALGRGGAGAASAARALKARLDDRRAARTEAAERFDAPAPLRAEPALAAPRRAASAPVAPAATARPERLGLLSLLPGVVRRAPAVEPELIEPELLALSHEAPSDDRIRARISSAIQNRVSLGKPVRPAEIDGAPRRVEPPLTAARSAPMPPGQAQEPDEDRLFADYETLAGASLEMPPRPSSADIYAPKPVVQTPARPAPPSRKAEAERQPALPFDAGPETYEAPPLSLLANPTEIKRHQLSNEALEENARMLETVLDDYGVKGEIVSVRPGPVVTMYELEPAPGVKASRVIGLADDIARSMSALSARVSTVPGRSVIGIELPNAHREKVVLREILSSRDFGDGQQKLPLALGKDIAGEPVVANLSKMPHLLIAGTTGSGKSVAINTMILSLLYKLSPEECRLIMIDPKMLELSVYDG